MSAIKQIGENTMQVRFQFGNRSRSYFPTANTPAEARREFMAALGSDYLAFPPDFLVTVGTLISAAKATACDSQDVEMVLRFGRIHPIKNWLSRSQRDSSGPACSAAGPFYLSKNYNNTVTLRQIKGPGYETWPNQ
jgi:hypothetical protein